MSAKRKIDRERYLELVEIHGQRGLACLAGIPSGTLSMLASGKRRPNATHRRELCRLGLLPEPRRRRRIEWGTVARLLAVTDDSLESILRDAKVDIDRARRRARECINS